MKSGLLPEPLPRSPTLHSRDSTSLPSFRCRIDAGLSDSFGLQQTRSYYRCLRKISFKLMINLYNVAHILKTLACLRHSGTKEEPALWLGGKIEASESK